MPNPLRTLMRCAPLSIALLAGVTTGAGAQDKLRRDNLLVTTDWLATQLDNPKLVLLHVGQKDEYDAGHIAGARFLQMRDLSTPMTRDTTVLALEMPSPESSGVGSSGSASPTTRAL